MKQLVQFFSNGNTELIEVPIPKLKDNSLLIKSKISLLSLGTEKMLVDFGKANIIEKAKQQEKLLIISIGYSACHWCHVMEKETFSDNHVAEIMNKHFISIKVDREEQPAVDHVYMDFLSFLSFSYVV